MAVKATNQVTIVDISDAYSVMLTSETATLPGSNTGVVTSTTVSTQAIMYCGSKQVSAVTVGTVTCPTGVTAAITNNGTANPTVTFTCAGSIASGAEAVIPVSGEDVTVNKRFTFAVAKTGSTGSTGKGIKSTVVTYQASTSGTTAPTGTWQSAIPTVAAGSYLWTRTVWTYTDNTSETSYSVAKQGSTGATGAPGADAITIEITADGPLVFKNSEGSVTLTAHVYKGGTEQTVNANGTVANSLGTVKWYVGNSTTGTAAKTMSVSATSVTNAMAYTAQLEA